MKIIESEMQILAGLQMKILKSQIKIYRGKYKFSSKEDKGTVK